MTHGSRKSAACIAGSLAMAIATGVALSANADPPATGVLTMRLALRNSSGQVGCNLYNSEKGFPTDATMAIQGKWCGIANAESLCRFDPIPAGTYAVACFHDENKNRRLDQGLFGRPLEGTVVSNNAHAFMAPPSFKDAKFWFPGTATELRLKMSY